MGRSLKKGPFVDAKLYKRIEEMNTAGEKESLRHGHVVQQFFLNL